MYAILGEAIGFVRFYLFLNENARRYRNYIVSKGSAEREIIDQ